MRLMNRLLAASAAICLLSVPAVAVGWPAAASLAVQEQPAEASTIRPARRAWAQDLSDIPADPAVRFGTLPNGVRYAILRNATPPGQAALRLRVDTGSLMEADDQLGLAHFMEHMAFNGTTNIPEGELLPILERLGLAFGPDTNAFTSFDQTVYMLDIPNANTEALDTGVMILREMAGEALLDAGAIDRERGIILSEERARANPMLRSLMAQLNFLMPGQLAAERLPIGDPEILRTAPREAFARYYNGFYRPERTTVIAVGDFDVDAMEARIRDRFSGWTAEGEPAAEPDLGPVLPRGTEAAVYSETGVSSSVSITWTRAPDHSVQDAAQEREDLITALGMAVLNRRLSTLARGENPPFVNASGGETELFDSVTFASVTASYAGTAWQPALAAIEAEQRRLVEFGVRQDELDREITEYRAALEAAVAGQATRQTPALAEALFSSVNDQIVFSSPERDLQAFNAIVQGLSAETVNAAVREAFTGNGPLIFLTSPTPVEGGDAAVLEAFNAARSTAVTAAEAGDTLTWDYTSFGTPGTVVEQETIEAIGTTTVRFENGVLLTVKPTDFSDEQVLVSVGFGDGLQALAPDAVNPNWVASNALTDGGLQRLSAEQLEQVLAGEIYSVALAIGNDAATLSGETRTGDLETQLQVLAAFATDAAWRPQAFERMRAAYQVGLPQLDSTPQGVFSRDGSGLLVSGDGRLSLPTLDQINAAEIATVRDYVEGQFDEGPVRVTIVGDVTVEDAIRLTAATFGALPARADTVTPAEANRRVRFPAGTAEPVVLTHGGRADQALAYVGWATTGARENLYESRTLNLLRAVIQLRLIDVLREGEAVTYSPSTSASSSWQFEGFGSLATTITVQPGDVDRFFEAVDQTTADLRETLVDADELERARRPAAEQLARARVTNEYWLQMLADLQTDELRLGAVTSSVEDLARITPEELREAARRYLTPDRAYRLVVLPREAPAAE